MIRTTTLSLASLLLAATHINAQTVLIEEHFTDGMSNAGFTTTSGPVSDCDWVFAPAAITELTFNQDFGDSIPAGAGFDEYFAFIDSDVCTGSTSNTVDSYLTSPPFDASGGAAYILSFDHQFRDFTGSTATVQVFNGATWTDVAYWEDNVGYPNPAAHAIIDITNATGGSAVAQVRFRYYATWDWWWAIDNILVVTGSVGLDALAAAQPLQLFPNPVNDVLHLRTSGADTYHVTIVDAMGRTVQQQRIARSLDVSALNTGAYTLLLHDLDGTFRTRAPFVKH